MALGCARSGTATAIRSGQSEVALAAAQSGLDAPAAIGQFAQAARRRRAGDGHGLARVAEFVATDERGHFIGPGQVVDRQRQQALAVVAVVGKAGADDEQRAAVGARAEAIKALGSATLVAMGSPSSLSASSMS